MQNYLNGWPNFMLNSEAEIITLAELIEKDYQSNEQLFIRPNADDKAFAGVVMSFGEMKSWLGRIKGMSNNKLGPDTKLVISPPYRIRTEWRLWIVNGKMAGASQYREDFKLSIKEGCPKEVRLFAESRCSEYLLDEVFVMDICKSGDSLYILECGCVNNAGFYAVNLKEMMRRISEYVALKNRNPI